MSYWHKNLKERFSTFPFYQQILMIGNELNRAKNFCGKNQSEVHFALERALELMDFASKPSLRFQQLRELRRAREVVAELYSKEDASKREIERILRVLLQMHPKAFQTIAP